MNITYSEYRIYFAMPNTILEREEALDSEIRELNRLICNQCSEREYEKCKSCKVYKLINKIAIQ